MAEAMRRTPTQAVLPAAKTPKTLCPSCHPSKGAWCHLCVNGEEWGQPMLFPPQARALKLMRREKPPSIVLATGTGTGKTTDLRIAIQEQRKRGTFVKALVLEPLKALAEQLARDMRKWFPDLKVVEVSSDTAGMVGVGEERNLAIKDADIAVCTYESVEYMTRDPRKYSAIHEASLLWVDEAHSFGETDRGANLDTGVTRYLLASYGRKLQVLLASATIANPEDFQKWLASFGLDAEVVHSDFSPILTHLDPRVYVYSTNDDRVRVLSSLAVRALREKHGPVMVLLLHRGLTQEVANAVNREMGANTAFIHHAGLSRERRQQTEQMFREGLVKVLVSTPTLLKGVNLPGMTIVFDTSFFDAVRFRHQSVKTDLILQAMGRGGRLPFWREAYVHLCARADNDWERKMAAGLVGRRPSPPTATTGTPPPEVLEFLEKLPPAEAAWVKRRATGAEVPPAVVAEVLFRHYSVFKRDGHPDATCYKLAMNIARAEAPGSELAEDAPSALQQLEAELNSPCIVRGALLDSPAATILSQVVIKDGATDRELLAFLGRTFAWHSYQKRRWGRSCRLSRITHAAGGVPRHHTIEGRPLALLPLSEANIRSDPSDPPDEGFLRDLRWLSGHGFVRSTPMEKGASITATRKGNLTHLSGLDPRRVQEVLDAIDRQEVTTHEQFLSLLSSCYGISNKMRLESYVGILRGAWLSDRGQSPTAVMDLNWSRHPSDLFGDDLGSEVPHLDLVVRPLTEGSTAGGNYDILRRWSLHHGLSLPLTHLAMDVEAAGGDPDHRQLLLAYLNGARSGKPLPPLATWRLPTQVQNLAAVESGGEPRVLAFEQDAQRIRLVGRGWPI